MSTPTIFVQSTLFGYQLCLRQGDCISRDIVQDGFYKGTEIVAIQACLKNMTDPICLEIGANVGTHGLAMSQYSQQVYMFEPQPDNVALIQQSLKLNQTTNCTIIENGLSNIETDTTLYVNLEGNNGGSTTDADFYNTLKYQSKEIKVHLRRGDDVVADQAIPYVNLIKIDVEGLEAEVLEGLTQTIAQHQPILFLEWYHDKSREKFAKRDLFNTLLKDYTVTVIANDLHRYQQQTKGDALRYFKRLVYKKLNKTRYLVTEDFKFEKDYSLIMCYPNNKTDFIRTMLAGKPSLPR